MEGAVIAVSEVLVLAFHVLAKDRRCYIGRDLSVPGFGSFFKLLLLYLALLGLDLLKSVKLLTLVFIQLRLNKPYNSLYPRDNNKLYRIVPSVSCSYSFVEDRE